MKFTVLLALTLVAPLLAEPPARGKWQLTFSDEFDGNALDSKRWEPESGSPTHILSSRWPENIVVKDGLCRLVTKKESRGGKEWTSAHFWTRTFRQKYGYYEARYRYNSTTGLNNAFWLMTRANEATPTLKFELDINEGHTPSEINMNIHQWAGTHSAKSEKFISTLDLSRDFHVYGFEWSEKELIWYLDGREIRRAKNEIAHGEVPVIFSTAVMKWAGEITDKLDGSSMDVDYVRVYRRTDTAPAVLPEMNIASMIQPVPESAKFIDPDYYIWCGSMTRTEDGKYHLFYSRWPRKLGHYAWVTNSEIAHAIGDSPTGPFRHHDVSLPARGQSYWDGLDTHNPTIQRFGGKFYLYYTGNTGDGKEMKTLNWVHRNNQRIGVAVADSPNGPWKRSDKPLLDVSADPDAPDALVVTNPSVTRDNNGRYLMIYKAVAKKRPKPFGGPVVHLTATAKSPTGPFTKQLKPIFTSEGADFPAEDPFVWYQGDRDQYYAIVKDFNGYFTKAGKSLALFQSEDGLDWKPSKNALVSKTEIRWASGLLQKVNSLERPQLLFENGMPVLLLGAVDETKERTHSYNVQIPLKAF